MEIKVKQHSYSSIYIIDIVGELDLYNSHKNNLKLQIANVRGFVKQVIELTKLMNYFPISNSLEEAISKIEQ